MISRVTNKVLRGPRLSTNNGAYGELKEFWQVKTIINLEDDVEASSLEERVARRHGMHMISLPMSEIFRPTRGQLQLAVWQIQSAEKLGNVYVHCKHGQDRTGYVIAAYRMMVMEWSLGRAYEEARDMGHKWWFAPYLLLWPKSLKELAR